VARQATASTSGTSLKQADRDCHDGCLDVKGVLAGPYGAAIVGVREYRVSR